jgi:hypothetical protein
LFSLLLEILCKAKKSLKATRFLIQLGSILLEEIEAVILIFGLILLIHQHYNKNIDIVVVPFEIITKQFDMGFVLSNQ